MNKKTWIRIGIIVVIIGLMGFSDWSFAQSSENFGDLGRIINIIVNILSRIWILFAKIAGEFLTNKWVYGEILGIDVLLWRYRNVVKNMANFCLGFYLLYVIFKGLIGQSKGNGKITESLKKTLLRTLIAGVGVQASRFLTSVVVDLSTITLTAAGALPAQIISRVDDVEISIEQSVKDYMSNGGYILTGTLYTLFPKDGAANNFSKVIGVSLNEPVDKTKFFDGLIPNEDDVSGPLYYMGFSILRTHKINSIGDWSLSALKKSIINLIIQGGTTVVYSVEMGVLCVLALMRILYLWMFIVLSPLAILLACIGGAGEKDLLGKSFISSLMKQINLKTFFLKVFQPVIVVLGISLCMIFVSLVSSVMNKDPTRSMENLDIGGVKISAIKDSNPSTTKDETYTTKLDGNLLEFSVSKLGKGILDFMVSIITVVLVYLIIKAAVKMGGGDDFVSKSINKLQDNVEGAITSVPILPVTGYDEKGVPKTTHLSFSGLTALPVRKVNFLTEEKSAITNEQVDSIMKQWGLADDNTLTASQESGIRRAGANSLGLKILEEKRAYINDDKNEIKTERGKGMVLNPNATNKFWAQEFTKWLNETKPSDVSDQDWNSMLAEWQKEPDQSKRNLKSLFKNKRYAEVYARFFGYTSGNYIDFDSIMNLDISKK